MAYVQDGVLLNPIPLASSVPGAVGIVARDDILVDLSLLEPVRTAKVEEDMAWMKAEEERLAADASSPVLSMQEGERCRVLMSMREYWRNHLRRGI